MTGLAAVAVPTDVGAAIVVLSGEPAVINPVGTTTFGDQFSKCLIFRGLVNIQSTETVLPELAALAFAKVVEGL